MKKSRIGFLCLLFGCTLFLLDKDHVGGADRILEAVEVVIEEDISVALEEMGTLSYMTGKGTVTCVCDGDVLHMMQD